MTKKSDFLKNKLNQIPELPGIYKMLDSRGNIIYIGKSKCLKRRVKSYFVKSHKWEKVNQMVSFIKDIDYIVTDTHLEARLLECELIKTHKPHFNAQMKNDQSYVYVKVEVYNQYNPLRVVDQREEDAFGPFRSKYSLNEFLNSLKNIYPLIKSNDGYEFEYHLFPVTLDRKTFDENKQILLELFQEDDRIMLLNQAIQTKMEEAASSFRFEAAAFYRDMINGFTYLKNGLNGYKNLTSKEILLKIPVLKGIKLFYISNGQIINRESHSLPRTEDIHEFIRESKDLLVSFLPDIQDEKSYKDYRDVMYSEISSMPEDQVEILS